MIDADQMDQMIDVVKILAGPKTAAQWIAVQPIVSMAAGRPLAPIDWAVPMASALVPADLIDSVEDLVHQVTVALGLVDETMIAVVRRSMALDEGHRKMTTGGDHRRTRDAGHQTMIVRKDTDQTAMPITAGTHRLKARIR